MKVDEWTSKDVHTPGGGELPPLRWTYLQHPPQSSKAQYPRRVHKQGVHQKCTYSSKPKAQKKEEDVPHWYALRTTYGREKKGI